MEKLRSGWGRSPWRKLIPRNVAVLGEITSCCLRNPDTGQFFGWDPRPGGVLCSDASGRRMYVLRPERDAGPARYTRQSIRAAELHERFVHREADGYFNAEIPPARKPRFVGELAIISYVVAKDLDKEIAGEEVEWVHYFEQPGVAPAFPEVWAIGHEQFYIPPGAWCVDSDGIDYAPPPDEINQEELHGSTS